MGEGTELTPQELEEVKDIEEEIQEDTREKASDDQHDSAMEFQAGYGPPEQEESHNTHSFLNKAAFTWRDTLRVTNLDKDELGKPIFNVRFLLDMEDIAQFYLAEMCEDLKVTNKIAQYFKDKVKNITDSGMSKEGFTMLMNTTKNVNLTRTKKRERLNNLKGKA